MCYCKLIFGNLLIRLANNLLFSQAGEEMEKYSCDKTETKKWNNSHLPSPVSILEPSFLTESCCSSETSTSCVTEGKNSAESFMHPH